MLLPGHIAVGFLYGAGVRPGEGELHRLRGAVPYCVLGGVLPDLIDKPIHWAHLSPYGRTVGHSVVTLLVLGLVYLMLRQRFPRLGVALVLILAGMATHLLADLVADLEGGLRFTGYVFSAWYGWPFTNPDQCDVHVFRVAHAYGRYVTYAEITVVAFAAVRAGGLAARIWSRRTS